MNSTYCVRSFWFQLLRRQCRPERASHAGDLSLATWWLRPRVPLTAPFLPCPLQQIPLRFAPRARVPAFLLLVTGLDVRVIWVRRLRPIASLFLPLAAVVSSSLLPRRVALWAVSYRHRQPPPQSPKVVTLKGAMAIEVPWPPTDGDPWIYTSLMQEMGVEGAQAEELYTLEMSEFEAVAYV